MKPIAIVITDTHLHKDNIDLVTSIFDQAIKYCKENGIDLILHAGDVFTSRTGQPLSVLVAWQRIVDKIRDNDLRCLAIAGNHDKTDQEDESSFLDIFNSQFFKVYKQEASYYGATRTTNFHFLPYF